MRVSQVAKRMGFAGFDYTNSSEIFAEHAALSGFENEGTRDFDIGGMASIGQGAYDAMAPVQWPLTATGERRTRFFEDGAFLHPRIRGDPGRRRRRRIRSSPARRH